MIIIIHLQKPTPPGIFIDFSIDPLHSSRLKIFTLDAFIFLLQLLSICILKQHQDIKETRNRSSSTASSTMTTTVTESHSNQPHHSREFSDNESRQSPFEPEPISSPHSFSTSNNNDHLSSDSSTIQGPSRMNRLQSFQIRRLQHFLQNYRRYAPAPSDNDVVPHSTLMQNEHRNGTISIDRQEEQIYASSSTPSSSMNFSPNCEQHQSNLVNEQRTSSDLLNARESMDQETTSLLRHEYPTTVTPNSIMNVSSLIQINEEQDGQEEDDKGDPLSVQIVFLHFGSTLWEIIREKIQRVETEEDEEEDDEHSRHQRSTITIISNRNDNQQQDDDHDEQDVDDDDQEENSFENGNENNNRQLDMNNSTVTSRIANLFRLSFGNRIRLNTQSLQEASRNSRHLRGASSRNDNDDLPNSRGLPI